MVTSDCLGGFLAFIFCHSNHASHVELSSVLLELPHPNSSCRTSACKREKGWQSLSNAQMFAEVGL